MSDTRPSSALTKARDALARVEAGDSQGVATIDDAHEAAPADVDAVQQEASDGPEGQGLAR